MNNTAKTLAALLLGAALITPAIAQDASANNGNSATAQNAPIAAPTTPVDSSTPSNVAANGAAASSSASTQMAMNTSGNAADLSSVPDTQKKYSRASRGKDFKSEAETTKALNQKATTLAQ